MLNEVENNTTEDLGKIRVGNLIFQEVGAVNRDVADSANFINTAYRAWHRREMTVCSIRETSNGEFILGINLALVVEAESKKTRQDILGEKYV